jgi:hypothetical protein
MGMKQIALLLLLLTSACAPQLVTQYEIVPPQSDNGRYCANGCLNGKSMCEQSCFDQQGVCEQQNRIAGQLDYLSYVVGRQADDRPIKRSPDSFRGHQYCSAEACLERCTQNYNVCHTNCGGKVIPHTTCAAFCE